jgi:hypothetical protein
MADAYSRLSGYFSKTQELKSERSLKQEMGAEKDDMP